MLGVILDGAYLCSRAAMAQLKRSGAGCIVNIGGMSAHTGSPGRAHVVTAKAGLVGLTRALAHELSPEGITVNCVVPGLIDTVRAASSTSGGSRRCIGRTRRWSGGGGGRRRSRRRCGICADRRAVRDRADGACERRRVPAVRR